MPAPFAAIDFETADARPISACAIAVVRVENDKIVARYKSLLKTPKSGFRFTRLHGISAKETKAAPTFIEAWNEASALLGGVAFIAAHFAAFDVRVLHTQCMKARILPPPISFVCTHLLAEEMCGKGNGALKVACDLLSIPLDHHEPLSDAEASAGIVLEARRRGIAVPRGARRRTHTRPLRTEPHVVAGHQATPHCPPSGPTTNLASSKPDDGADTLPDLKPRRPA